MARRLRFFAIQSEPLEQRIATGLAKIGLALKHQSWQNAGGRGLSPTQAQILALLAGAPEPQRPSALAERLAVSLPTVSESVRVLVEKKLVEKIPDAKDARATLLGLTASGRAEAKQAAGWPDFLASAAEALDDEEQEVFFTGLVKMIRTLQDRGQIPVSKMCVTCRYFRPNEHAGEALPHHCAFVDAPLGARHLRLECPDHDAAAEADRAALWDRFVAD
jgi:DNA-binding MarR family transcriptional regulator